MSRLAASGISVVRDGRTLLADASIELIAGEMHVLLGPNGAGKSTLLRALAGEWPIASGAVTLDGAPLRSLDPLQQARRRAVLPQQDALSFSLTVESLVALGRHAALDQREATHRHVIAAVLQATDTADLARRRYTELSGGERRRVQLARVLAQVWDVPQALLLLDEPVHSLDLAHQHAVLSLLKQLAARGFAILASLHELNHAEAFADRVSLIAAGRIVHTGRPDEVLDAARLKALFGESLAFESVPHGAGRHWLTQREARD